MNKEDIIKKSQTKEWLQIERQSNKFFFKALNKLTLKQQKFIIFLLSKITEELSFYGKGDYELYKSTIAGRVNSINLTKLKQKRNIDISPKEVKTALTIAKNDFFISNSVNTNNPKWTEKNEPIKIYNLPLFLYFNYAVVGEVGKQKVLIKYEIDPLFYKHFGAALIKNFSKLDITKIKSIKNNKTLNLALLVNELWRPDNSDYKITKQRFLDAFSGRNETETKQNEINNLLFELRRKAVPEYNNLNINAKKIYIKTIERMREDKRYITIIMFLFWKTIN